MLQGWIVIAVALGYIGLLFVIASYGDRTRALGREAGWRNLIYPLSLAIYCTSWTFFGSVGLASRTGFYDFLTIYIGPVLMIGLCSPLIMRIVRLAKAQNITSIADFIAARYGKAQTVAATVALIAIVGTIPYIALQLKAVSSSLSTILAHIRPESGAMQPVLGDISLFVAFSMAAFAVLFGTRHIDATEHQDGLMLAVATESIVKLVAFLAVGIFVTFWLFDGPMALFARALSEPATAKVLAGEPATGTLAAMTLLSLVAIVLLPRQFHVTVVENNSEHEVRRAAWLFPLYLVLINLFVVPIALAGLLTFAPGQVDSDMYVLALPLAAQSDMFTIVAFVGGLSAATAMVIVETVALAIMVSNDIVMPLVLKQREAFMGRHSVGWLLLMVRRVAIFAILFFAYVYYRLAGDAQLAAIGLLSFAAVAQLAPAFFGGLFWRRANARGAMAGMTIGILTWAYTLMLPSFADAGIVGTAILSDGPWGIAWLRPQALMGLDMPRLAHGVIWSLTLNILAYVAFSFTRASASIERVQADLFVPSALTPITPSFRLWRSAVTVEELTSTVARYLGEERTRTSFDSYASTHAIALEPKAEADFQLLRFAEHLLASAIGTASSRLVLSLLLRKRTVSKKDALKLLDDANAAIHYNREILQTALDHVRQGIAVFNKDLQLTCWNRQFGEMLELPPQFTRIGTPLEEILRHNVGHGALGADATDALVRERVARYVSASEAFLERNAERDLVIEVRANRMPDGGIVTTFTDITPSVKAAEELERANESLERRVQERTEELTLLNTELGRAKGEAEQANISKTRFLAAASHDILQPLNAARLYVTSLVERQRLGEDAPLIGNIDASLDAVEEILGALLDISRLDTGAMRPEIKIFRIDELLRQLEVDFQPLAQEKGLQLDFVPCSLAVKSDRRLLRRLLQNLVSNAIKYTPAGRVLVGCRRRQGRLRVDVYDTGLGIPQSKKQAIFQEFQRLDQGAKVARGLGLGLSIVERIARVLGHKIEVASTLERGSQFSVEVPLSAAVPARAPVRDTIDIDRGQLADICVLCIDNEPTILDGMETLLGGWGCRVVKAADLASALAALAESRIVPDALLVDYHLGEGTGIEAIAELRHRFAGATAILITADRGAAVREEARAQRVQVLNKPVKPAALRALLAQSRVHRVAAAE
jgi:Na+/proline symporter/signal transduction histidine kinase/CheY-like chemotaxis protein